MGAEFNNPPDSSSSSGAPPVSPGASSAGDGLHVSITPSQIMGRRLGQYTILEKIGQGGMGHVFKAFDTALERTVALKVLFSNLLDDPRQWERFMREARSLARLSHPNLLHVYNVGCEKDCYYFAMELLPGQTLMNEIRSRRRIPPPDLIFWLGQILSALQHVHKQGITHRDIKSGNIMLSERRAVLMDFGLAKDDHNAGLTSVGAMLGTPDYMSPEAAEGSSAGPPTDIYSLGVVMYEALSGGLPFVGRSAMSIIRQQMDTAPPPIQAALPNIDPLLASIVHKCLAKKPAERYPDCPALARDLARVLRTQDLEALAAEGMGEQNHTQRRPGPPRATPSALDATMIDSRAVRPVVASHSDGSDLTLTHYPDAPDLEVDEAAGTVAATAAPAPRVAPPLAAPPARRRPQWVWVALGFFGMIALAIFLAPRKRGGDVPPGKTQWEGQVIRQKGRGTESGERMRWIEFKGNDPDPSKWHHVVEKQQPDGSWVRMTIPHAEFRARGESLEFLYEREK